MRIAPHSCPPAQRQGRLHRFAPVVLCSCIMTLTGAANADPPVIFRVSEGVRPGALVSVYGDGLKGTPSVRFLGTDGAVIATQPAVQTDPDGHFCRVVFPSIPPGAYRLAAGSGDSWSRNEIHVNRAEPRWLSEERGYPGLRLKVIGRNLDAWEYNGTRNTRVRLAASDGHNVEITPDEVSPYCIDFTVPAGLKSGGYRVEVNTGSAQFGSRWVRLDNHSEYPAKVEATVLRVENAPGEGLARDLLVGWANDFQWNQVVNVRPGGNDDTLPIQDALDRLARQGGGVVSLGAGVYRVGGLVVGAGCVLKGATRDGTVILLTKASEEGTIVSRGKAGGVAGLTLRYTPEVPPSTKGVVLGGVAERFFIHDVAFPMVREPDVAVEQAPYYFTGPGPLLVAKCQFVLSKRNLWDHAVRNRVTFRENRIDMHDGLGLCMSSEKLLLLDNDLTFHPASYSGQMNGFFLNEGWMGWNIWNAYIAGNNAHELPGAGDCQPFAADSAWSCFAGAVTGSTSDSVDVRADLQADFKGRTTHELEALIVQGKGLGQLRRVTATRDAGGHPMVVKLTTCPPWDVMPDATSVVSVGSWHVNNVFYRNTAKGSKSAYNMYYGGSFDCLDADATSQDTDGFVNWGRIGEMAQGSWHTPVYFTQLKRSRFTGRALQYDTMGITIRVENETKTYRGIADYGTEIRDNMIDRSASSTKPQRLAGNAAIATFNQTWMPLNNNTPLILATLCEGNHLKNTPLGFDLDGCFSFAIRGNTYENCKEPVNDRGRATALIPGQPEPLKPWPAGLEPTGR